MKLWEKITSVGICVFLFWLISILIAAAQANKLCSQAGYDKSNVTYTYELYCSRLENATTQVINVKDLK